jgi:hypothetical protein
LRSVELVGGRVIVVAMSDFPGTGIGFFPNRKARINVLNIPSQEKSQLFLGFF